MLILTRPLGRRIIIRTPGGDEIVIRVVGIRGKQVSLGFEAPESVDIKREEIATDFKGK